jgi:hypothetical protein
MTLTALHAAPVQNDPLSWHIVPLGHDAAPSTSHRWAHVPPMMQTSPGEQVPASRPHFWVLVEQASPPAKITIPTTARSRLMR